MSPFESKDVVGSKADHIALLNDAFRTTLSGGKVLMTSGVAELPDMVKASAIQRVVAFDAFEEGNDPHGEHDFGSFELCGCKFFWKIDYYDHDLRHGSEDPADPSKTTRVLALLWQIFSGAGFPNQFFNDSWMVGFWRADHGCRDG